MTVGVGFTVIVKVYGVPSQLLADGVTVIDATASVVPVFKPVKLEIFPVPEAAKPIDALLFVQEYVVPETLKLEVKLTAVVAVFTQIASSATASTVGVGFTVTNTGSVPTQPLASVSVNVYVVVTGLLVTFDATKATPFTTLLSHAKVATPVPVKVTFSALQTVWSAPAFGVGKALIVMVAVPVKVLEQVDVASVTETNVMV